MSRERDVIKKRLESAKHSDYINQAKQGMSALNKDYTHDNGNEFHDLAASSIEDSPPRNKPASSAGSFLSLSHHAKSVLGTFSCTGGKNQAMSNREVKERRGFRGKGVRYQSDASPPPSVAGTSGSSLAKKTIPDNNFNSNHPRETNPNFRRGPRTDF